MRKGLVKLFANNLNNHFVYVALFVCSLTCPLQARTFQVGVVDSPPFILVHGDKKPTGLLVDIMDQLVKSCNFQLNYHFLSFKRFYDAVEKGDKSQIQFIAKGIERFEGNLLYSEQPVITIKLNLYWYQEDDDIRTEFSLSDLQNQSVLLMRGYHYAGLTERLKRQMKSIDFIEVDSVDSAFKMLSGHRARFLLQYQRIVDVYINKPSINKSGMNKSGNRAIDEFSGKIQSQNIKSIDYFISVHRSVDEAENVLACLSLAHRKLLLK